MAVIGGHRLEVAENLDMFTTSTNKLAEHLWRHLPIGTRYPIEWNAITQKIETLIILRDWYNLTPYKH